MYGFDKEDNGGGNGGNYKQKQNYQGGQNYKRNYNNSQQNNNQFNNNQSGGNNPGGGNRGKRPCKFFQQNKCRDGNNCKFSHDMGGGNNPGGNDGDYPMKKQFNDNQQYGGGNFGGGGGGQNFGGKCNFQFNWGQCTTENCDQQRHTWNKGGSVQLCFQTQDQNTKFINIFSYGENTMILVTQDYIQSLQILKNEDGTPNIQQQGTLNQFNQDGYIAKFAALQGDILLLSVQKQNNIKMFEIMFLNMQDGSHQYIKNAHQHDITGLTLIGQAIFSSSRDGTIKVWPYDQNANQFVLNKDMMNSFNNPNIKEFSSLYYNQHSGGDVILAGVKDNVGNAGIAVYTLNQGQINLYKIISTQKGQCDNTVFGIEKLDEDFFGVIVNHIHQQQQQQQQNSESQLFVIQLQGQQGKDSAPVYPSQENNKFNNVYSVIKKQEYDEKRDIITLGTIQNGTFIVLTQEKDNKANIQYHGAINPHSKSMIQGIAYQLFDINAIKFVYIFVVDDKGNFSVWSFQP